MTRDIPAMRQDIATLRGDTKQKATTPPYRTTPR